MPMVACGLVLCVLRTNQLPACMALRIAPLFHRCRTFLLQAMLRTPRLVAAQCGGAHATDLI